MHFVRFLFRWSLRAAALAAALFTWAVAIEPSRLVLQDDEVRLRDWRAPPLRVALISDLHVGSPWITLDYLERLVARTNTEKPDVVLLLGDFDINGIPGGEKVAPERWAPILGRLEAPTYAVLGNHDWWNDHRRIRGALEAAGVDVLENEAKRLGRWWLVGVGDSYTGHDRVARAFAGVPKGASVVAMTHTPDVSREIGTRADLVVAGHTHGGQVRLPWITERHLKLDYYRGLYPVSGTSLYVTSGVGTSLLPFRFRVPPEVVILTVEGEHVLADAG